MASSSYKIIRFGFEHVTKIIFKYMNLDKVDMFMLLLSKTKKIFENSLYYITKQ